MMIFNLIIIVLVFLISYHLYKSKTIIFICFLPFLVQYLWMFLSILVIERGIYIDEQDRNGEFIFASFYLLSFFIASIVSFVFFFKLFDKIFKIEIPRIRLFKVDEMKIVMVITTIIIFLSYLNLLSSPSTYNDSTISKFNYWEYARFPILKGVLGSTIGYLPFIFGIVYKRYKKTTILFILLYLFYLVGVDQKFTALLFGGISFLLSYSIINFNFGNNKNILLFKKRYLIIIGILLFSLVLLKYTYKNSYAHLGLSPVESVFYRAFGLQAHLFWGVSEKYVINNKPNTWDISELPYGMHILMEDFIPINQKKHLKSLWERGVSWTNGYPAILLRIFPFPIAIVFHFFIFSIIPFTYALLVKAFKRKNFLLAIILFQLILWLLNVYSMAYFYRLSKIIMIFVLISLLSYLFNKKKSDNEASVQ